MIVGLYTSVTGKAARSENMDVIARNLANINTIGFKKNMASFSTFMDGDNAIPGVSLSKLSIDHEQGSVKATGNKLDLAITGNGFFTMDTGNGLRYSRNGHFVLNSEMELVNAMGWKLTGSTGAVSIPKNAKDVLIGDSGSVSADGVIVGKLRIVNFEDKSDLKEVGNSSFKSKSNSEGDIAEGFTVQQGYLENSNVSVIEEMVNMIVNNRSFQGNNRVNKTIDGTLEKLIRTAYTVI